MKKTFLPLILLAVLLLPPLQAGAAPGNSSFSDVPLGHWAWQWIESLYQAGITGGCQADPLAYCPESNVKRAEMAVFLERGIHGASYSPPGASGAVFADVPSSHWAAGWIEQLAAEGITAGCGGGNYCPESPATRAEMAVFLLRAEHGSAYTPPPAGGTQFADVPDINWAAAWIEQLAAEGITAGCGDGNYCPDSPVTRAQMAVFLVRTFNLPLVPKPASPMIGGCPLFPADNIWNTPVDALPVHALSAAWVDFIGRYDGFHMDFGSGTWDGGPIGIPYNLADASAPQYTFDFYYPGESDPGPYPIPIDYKREWGSDHHILVVDTANCTLYELYDASTSGGQWYGGSGAVWDLNSNALRPDGWTSADAAGLPILPGLVRYDEIVAGEINHALRFTAHATNSYIWPARHLTSGTPGVLTSVPPMGARFRLKAGYDISSFPPELQVILQAMKTYGILLADNGSDWYVSGAPDERWDNDMLHLLDVLTGNDFEAVEASSLMVSPDSGQAVP
jgi:S-layer homology domain